MEGCRLEDNRITNSVENDAITLRRDRIVGGVKVSMLRQAERICATCRLCSPEFVSNGTNQVIRHEREEEPELETRHSAMSGCFIELSAVPMLMHMPFVSPIMMGALNNY